MRAAVLLLLAALLFYMAISVSASEKAEAQTNSAYRTKSKRPKKGQDGNSYSKEHEYRGGRHRRQQHGKDAKQ